MQNFASAAVTRPHCGQILPASASGDGAELDEDFILVSSGSFSGLTTSTFSGSTFVTLESATVVSFTSKRVVGPFRMADSFFRI